MALDKIADRLIRMEKERDALRDEVLTIKSKRTDFEDALMKKTEAKIAAYKEEQKRALPINGVSKFDMQKFKEYVQTYDAKKNGLDNDDTIVKDMLYGIGLCLNKKEFEFADGFKKFKTFIKAFL